MLNYFAFAGRRCTDFGVHVQRFPAQPKPLRQVETISVPGRCGTLRIDKGGFENLLVSYDCYFRGGPQQASEVAAWLYSAGSGYSELRDTYHPDFFRRAAFDGPLDMENVLNRYGRCIVTFDCKPQLFSDVGQQPVPFAIPSYSGGGFTAVSLGKLYNPYQFPAKPLIKIGGYTNGQIHIINSKGDMGLFYEVQGGAYIDCETQNMYYRDDVNVNCYLTQLTEFPVLMPGENEIVMYHKAVVSPGDEPLSLVITPRWWKL